MRDFNCFYGFSYKIWVGTNMYEFWMSWVKRGKIMLRSKTFLVKFCLRMSCNDLLEHEVDVFIENIELCKYMFWLRFLSYVKWMLYLSYLSLRIWEFWNVELIFELSQLSKEIWANWVWEIWVVLWVSLSFQILSCFNYIISCF